MQFRLQNLLISVVFMLISTLSIGQENMSAAFEKSPYNADKLYNDGNYLRALAVYDSLWDKRPNDIYLQYKTGICHIHQATGRDKAYDILKNLVGETGYDDVMFYLARAKHLNYQFEDAIDLYNDYLTTYRPTGLRRIETLHFLSNCRNGVELMKRRLALSPEILTPPSNNTNSQYSPVISPDGEKLYFTNRGPESKGEMMDEKSKKNEVGFYYEDIFVASKEGEGDDFTFKNGESLSDNINDADRHEAPLSISYDNQMLFLYLSGNKESEDIYVSYNQGDTAWSKPTPIKGVNTPQWEGHASMAPDGKTLYFSTDKPGGYGGRDIYSAIMKPDSTYGNVQNLGPKINTPFNED